MSRTVYEPVGGLSGQSYLPLDGHYDEMAMGPRQLRSHWLEFMEGLERITAPGLARRWAEVRRLIRENGVTFNVHGDPRGRLWELDPLPILFDELEWKRWEQGLTQRARLLDRILEDVYGTQDLVREGLLPPELVFSHQGYLRPCHGLCLPPASRLLLYAADLGRTPSGEMVVLRDRTQAPPGCGYSLENRLVLARMLPEVFRECKVARLSPFFQELRRTLSSLAVRNPDNPCIVLLTPGPGSETFFEHAYLAQYLGCTLVEGDDLTVRDNCVFLKLLEGLQPVDVIVRRLNDSYCDPLELRPESLLGVPGLVQAIHSGNVVVANALGSGWLETPALAEYLPALCRSQLGEELLLPCVPSWWCGQEKGLQHVLTHLAKMVVRPAFPYPRQQPVFGEALDSSELESLASEIKARPQLYVGQEQVALSSTPAWDGRGMEPRHLVLRAFLAATASGSYRVMPGGLCRVSASADSLLVTMHTGGGSKDTWVLESTRAPEKEEHSAEEPAIQLSRGGGDIPSRAADNLYWLGRYVERVEGLVRLLRGCLIRLTEFSGLEDASEVPILLASLGTLPEPQGRSRVGLSWCQERIRYWVRDTERSDSLSNLLVNVNRLADTVRDRVSSDSWRILSHLKLPSKPPDELSDVQVCLEQLIVTIWAFSGMATDSMHRGFGWRFLDAGRRLERCLHTARLLTVLGEPTASEAPVLEAVLEICDSSRTYRRRYQALMSAAAAVDLLLTDETNPRSIAFQLATLEGHLAQLPHDPLQPRRSLEERIVLGLLTELRLADVAALCHESRRKGLIKLLERLDDELAEVSESITQNYLTHLQPSRQLPAFSSEWRREV